MVEMKKKLFVRLRDELTVKNQKNSDDFRHWKLTIGE